MGLANRAWQGWQLFLEHRRHIHSVCGAAARKRLHRVLLAWSAAAQRAKHVKQHVAGILARSGMHKAAAAMAAWVAFWRTRKRLALGARMADDHRNGTLLYRCFWTWSRAAELAAAARAQAHGVMQFQRLVQVSR